MISLTLHHINLSVAAATAAFQSHCILTVDNLKFPDIVKKPCRSRHHCSRALIKHMRYLAKGVGARGVEEMPEATRMEREDG
jgi:hypothetical protein